jgi:serine O-acetyltransferase
MLRLSSSLPAEGLARLAVGQLNAMFPDGEDVRIDDLMPAMPEALARLEHCFSHVANKYFFDGKRSVFSHLHGDQYTIWLYYLSNTLFRQGASTSLCSKLFLLNKALHGCDIFYEVALPSVFLVVHPLATVLGRGNYSDFFVSYQRCGVGSNKDVYPTFGKYVTLRPGSAVLGKCQIGENCQIAAESLVMDRDLPDNTLYFGDPKTARTKTNVGHYPLWRT